jgi:hypothetical protein
MTGDRDHLVTDGPFAESKEVALAGWIRPGTSRLVTGTTRDKSILSWELPAASAASQNWSSQRDVHWTS